MREILPGVYHWSTRHPNIGKQVSSCWLDEGGVLIDPLIPEDVGIEWFAERSQPPAAVVLSNRHHYRDSGALSERFGIPVYCVRAGLHEFGPDRPVKGFDPGEEHPGELVAFEICGICPDETALHIGSAEAMLVADGVVRGGPDDQEQQLGFVSDALMDDPPETKRKLIEAYGRALEQLSFEHVLLAHGEPLIGDGRRRLQEFVDSGGRTSSLF